MGIRLILPAALAGHMAGREPWLEVAVGEPRLEAVKRHAIQIHYLPAVLGTHDVERWLGDLAGKTRGSTALQLVASPKLSMGRRQLLEQRGFGYLDWSGNLPGNNVVSLPRRGSVRPASAPCRSCSSGPARFR